MMMMMIITTATTTIFVYDDISLLQRGEKGDCNTLGDF